LIILSICKVTDGAVLSKIIGFASISKFPESENVGQGMGDDISEGPGDDDKECE
jgi:hypothetical protein